MSLLLTGAGVAGTGTPPGYTGLGDVFSGAFFYGGMRAYNAAYAAPGTNNGASVTKTGLSSSNIKILSSGYLDVASANSFAGTDCTATSGSATASTTLAVVGASSTPNVGDTLTATVATGSLVQPALVLAVGTFTGGSGTVTLLTPQTCTLTSLVFQNWLVVNQLYDQSGNANVMTNASVSTSPWFLPDGGDGKPAMYSDGSRALQASTLVGGPITANTLLAVMKRTGNFTTDGSWISTRGASNTPGLKSSTSANTADVFAGAFLTAPATDNVRHVLITVPSGASGTLTVDGSTTTGNTGTGGASAGTALGVFRDASGGSTPTGIMWECAGWSTGASTGQIASLNSNATAAW